MRVRNTIFIYHLGILKKRIDKKTVTLLGVLILFLASLIVSYLFYSNDIELIDIRNYTGDNLFIVGIIFLLIYSLRIFLFIPSTLIIITLGIISQNITFTFFLSIIGVGIGLIETYYMGYLLNNGINGNILLNKVKPQVEKIKEKGFTYILIGCFFPIFPTDIISYACGFMKYNFKNFFLAGILGESILVFLYSFMGINAHKFIPHLIILGGSILFGYSVFLTMKSREKK